MTEGLHLRRKENLNKEDEAEFLDEEDQEKLIQELREQNDGANLNIQRGLIFVGCMMSVLFFNILLQKGSSIIIPISQIYIPTESAIISPKFAAITSNLSIFSAIFTLILSSRISLFSQHIECRIKNVISVKNAIIVTIFTGSIAPIMSLKSTSVIEFIFWLIPCILIIMYSIALYMINQVYDGLDELEGSKYKYKGV
ncbi:MAG: hypothetical protein EXX96DRAFT_568469 [Benjaminiella poitrasii]|nr:MAG: hypothetical protein EXX96DRAFT_568469 [Benjaminiella poitrasii]